MIPYRILLLLCLFQTLLLSPAFPQAGTQPEMISMKGAPIGVAWGFAYGYGTKSEVFLPQLSDMGVHLAKLYLFWQQIEPVKDQYDWTAVDAFLSQLTPGDEALIAVWSSSTWATKVSSAVLPPSPAKSQDDYYRFIQLLVKHCKGKIKFWQNDCEPNNPVYWSGTDEEFINQLKTFYKAVKDADSNALVVMGGYDGLFNPPGMPPIPGQDYGLAFFGKAIKEASAYFDIFDLRLYANPYTIPARVQYFRQKLSETGSAKPIICTEYNGPGFFGFPVNFKYVNMVATWQKSISVRDTAAYRSIKNPIASMYDSIDKLSPQTQMFMMGCSKELNDKYYRMQCYDIVMSNVFALSAGVQKTFYWDLWHDTSNKLDLMTLMFGKNKLMDFDNQGKLTVKYPQVEVLKRMTGYLNDVKTVKRIQIPGKENLFLFEIGRTGKKPLYVIWEQRNFFTGEDQPANNYLIPWQTGSAKATDVFGNNIQLTVKNNTLTLNVALTPIYIEAR